MSGKIFTHDIRLAQGDLSKINEIEHDNIINLFSGLRCMKGLDAQYIPKFKFFQFKKCKVYDRSSNNYKFMLCFNDISQKILYDTSKAEGELLTLINSTISHEMRNPLNSIINQCSIMEQLSFTFKGLLNDIKEIVNNNLYEEMNDIFEEYMKSIKTQKTSS